MNEPMSKEELEELIHSLALERIKLEEKKLKIRSLDADWQVSKLF